MTFTLESVVPWGRSYHEYKRMFVLTRGDLSGSILGCADGPASFNAEAAAADVDVVSCDPLYRFSASEIRSRIDETHVQIMAQTQENHDEFLWTEFASPRQMGDARMQAMEMFLKDYHLGQSAGRYVDAELPRLPFQSRQFDLALCSHFLFLYSDHQDLEFHCKAILEMTRVAREVRIFPLDNLGGAESVHLSAVVGKLQKCALGVTLEVVPYEIVRGSNRMMRVTCARGE